MSNKELEQQEYLERCIRTLYTNDMIEQCVFELSKDREAWAYETPCGNLYLNGEDFQVMVKVVRGEENFEEDFSFIKHVIK